jgi:hypothetical protein
LLDSLQTLKEERGEEVEDARREAAEDEVNSRQETSLSQRLLALL